MLSLFPHPVAIVCDGLVTVDVFSAGGTGRANMVTQVDNCSQEHLSIIIFILLLIMESIICQ
jgi:hypothetical protein